MALVFDRSRQKEYVLGFHKRNLQRKEKAALQAKQAFRQQVNTERKMRREDARQIYNANCQVPILPNLTLATENARRFRTSHTATNGGGGEDLDSKEQQYDVGDSSISVSTSPLEPVVDMPEAPTPPRGAGGGWVLPPMLNYSSDQLRKTKNFVRPKKEKPTRRKPKMDHGKFMRKLSQTKKKNRGKDQHNGKKKKAAGKRSKRKT
eukprot:TRINITY_DN3839_c0_g1_i1.p1 TRINITY_DN3839_c0_g1~~TRINITY_DN3839_c0_g1_i1.p1  ORF type:complete len:206 (-),score=26.02 TRINITY_DN3839_c0_g1_i1:4-621(-)